MVQEPVTVRPSTAERLYKCYECGYPLGSLPQSNHCPECGADAEYSRLSLLQRLPRPERVRRAFTFAVILLCTLGLIPILAISFGIVFFKGVPDRHVATVAIFWALLIGVWIGAWMMFALNDPSARTNDRHRLPLFHQSFLGASVSAMCAFTLLVHVCGLLDAPDVGIPALAMTLAIHLHFATLIATRLIQARYRTRRRLWSVVLAQITGAALVATLFVILAIAGYSKYQGIDLAVRPNNLGDLHEYAVVIAFIAMFPYWLTHFLVLCSLTAALHDALRRSKHLLARSSKLPEGVAP